MITFTATIAKDDGGFINIDHRNSVSLDRTIKDRSDMKLPKWGLVSNSGKIDFIDYDSSILTLAEQRLLKNGMEVKFSIFDTMSRIRREVGTFYTRSWGYDKNNKKVSVDVTDGLEEWQDIPVPAIEHSIYYTPNTKTYADAYKELYSLTPSKFNMISFEDLDAATQKILIDRKMASNIRKENNLWSAWDALASASLCHIFRNNMGVTTFRYNGGN